MKLSRLLCRFAWYRRLRGGSWRWHEGRWYRVTVEVIVPIDFSDDFTLREDLEEFFSLGEKEKRSGHL